MLVVLAGAAYFGGRFLTSPSGRYWTAQTVFRGKPDRVSPVLNRALARACTGMQLPPPYPNLVCRPDSTTGVSLCSATLRLTPGISPIQANARITQALTDLGVTLVRGAEAADGSVNLRFQAGTKVSVSLDLIPAASTGLDTVIAPAPNLPAVDVKVRLALIIDDYGEDPAATRQFASLPGQFTAAVRSNLPNAKGLAAEARSAGMEVILNLPMEPQNYPTTNPGQDAILVDLSGREIRKRIRSAVEEVGPVKGVKTYMGDLAVEDRDVMRAVLEELQKENLYLVDNTTSTYSTVPDLAREIGVLVFTAERSTEVDRSHRGEGTLGIRFDSLLDQARKAGYGIGIVHSSDAMLSVLKSRLPALAREGIVVMGLSEVMKAYALE